MAEAGFAEGSTTGRAAGMIHIISSKIRRTSRSAAVLFDQSRFMTNHLTNQHTTHTLVLVPGNTYADLLIYIIQ